MPSIKEFFKKKAADIRFKSAGAAHKLTEARSKPVPARTEPVKREASGPSDAQIAAGSAALARLEKLNKQDYNRSLNAIRAQARKEIEEEEKQLNEPSSEGAKGTLQSAKTALPSQLATAGVFYTCPMIGPQVLPRKEIDQLIRDYLREQLQGEDAGLTACVVIHTLNKNREKVQNCVDTINRILENVIQNPTEEKFRKIRVLNKTFQEKVYYMEGSKEFLMSAGFQLVQLPGPDGTEEDYYVLMDFDEEKQENIQMLQGALNDAEAIRPALDRSLRVLFPAEARRKTELPDEFYNLTAEELKKEQELRKHVVEQELILRTKAMREREAQREKRKYRYTLIRIRFPDEIILQGTFKVNEKLRDVTSFIQEALEEPSRPFVLSFSGKKFQDQDVSLLDLELVPSVTLHFNWDQPSSESETSFLKETILALLENV